MTFPGIPITSVILVCSSSGKFQGIHSTKYYPELTATVEIPYIKKFIGFQGIPQTLIFQ
jgi:hypothetical protein